jgi:hypothetical protein
LGLGALAAVVTVLRKKRKADAMVLSSTGVLALCLCVHFFIADRIAGGDYLVARMALVAWMMFALVLVLFARSGAVAIALRTTAAIASVALVAVRWQPHHRVAEAARDHLHVCAAIPEGSLVLPLAFNYGSGAGFGVNGHPRFLLHVSGYAGAARRIIPLDNYEANTAYFQTRWLPEVDPFDHLRSPGGGDMETDPLGIDIAAYEQRIDRSFDHIVLCDVPIDSTDRERYHAFILGLAKGYDEVPSPHRGANAGPIRVFRRR